MPETDKKSLRGTQTEVNLMTAFATESQARNRYTYYASKAKEEGYVQIQEIFQKTADQEKEHAKRLYRFMDGPGEVEITASFPMGPEQDTLQNLKEAAAGEHHENTEMYPQFADIAEKEGFKEIADTMRNIAVAEKFHEKRYLGLAKNVEEGTVFKKSEKVTWYCSHCGYTCESKEAPKKCPSCAHPQEYFEIACENW